MERLCNLLIFLSSMDFLPFIVWSMMQLSTGKLDGLLECWLKPCSPLLPNLASRSFSILLSPYPPTIPPPTPLQRFSEKGTLVCYYRYEYTVTLSLTILFYFISFLSFIILQQSLFTYSLMVSSHQ